jgi:hypothetical protein
MPCSLNVNGRRRNTRRLYGGLYGHPDGRALSPYRHPDSTRRQKRAVATVTVYWTLISLRIRTLFFLLGMMAKQPDYNIAILMHESQCKALAF